VLPPRRGPGPLQRLAVLATALGLGIALGRALPARLEPPGDVPRVRVGRLAVAGLERVTAAELAALSGVASGTPAAEVSAAEVARRLAAHPWIEDARATVWLGSRLLVDVVEREPAGVAWLGEPPAPWHVDRSGTPFAPVVSAFGLERAAAIRAPAALEPGRPHAELADAVRVLEAAAARGLPVGELLLGSPGDPEDPERPALRLDATAGGRLALLGPGAPEAALDRLAALLAADPPEAREASVLDVRFGGQVVLRGDPETDDASGSGEASPRAAAGTHATGRPG
jgi:hypothetical protein